MGSLYPGVSVALINAIDNLRVTGLTGYIPTTMPVRLECSVRVPRGVVIGMTPLGLIVRKATPEELKSIDLSRERA